MTENDLNKAICQQCLGTKTNTASLIVFPLRSFSLQKYTKILVIYTNNNMEKNEDHLIVNSSLFMSKLKNIYFSL